MQVQMRACAIKTLIQFQRELMRKWIVHHVYVKLTSTDTQRTEILYLSYLIGYWKIHYYIVSIKYFINKNVLNKASRYTKL